MNPFKRNNRAAAGSQYALIVGLIGVVALAATASVGGNIKTLFTGVGNKLTGVSGGSVIVVQGPDPCASAPSVGTQCNDGTVYVGISNGQKMFVDPTDDGTGICWDNCDASWPNASSYGLNNSNGLNNTAILISHVNAGQHFQAAELCNAKTRAGLTWYLPSNTEMTTIYQARNAGILAGSFFAGSNRPFDGYYSSYDDTNSNVYTLMFNDGNLYGGNGNIPERVRCATRHL